MTHQNIREEREQIRKTEQDVRAERQGLREQYSSDAFWPLNRRQAKRFHQAALEASDPSERFVGLTLLYTGMRNGEFCHMWSEWITENPDIEGDSPGLFVEVPVAEVCVGGSGPRDANQNRHRRGKTCAACRRENRDHWIPKTGNGDRSIKVIEEAAADTIRLWFKQHDQVPLMHNAVNRRIRRIADRAGINRSLTAHDLRDTFATMLVRKGFDRREIKKLMGHNDTERLNDYYEFVGLDQQLKFEEKW